MHILFISLLTASATVPLAEHLKCKTADDCVLVSAGSCCSNDLSVGKKFADIYRKSADPSCAMKKVRCLETKAVCNSGACDMEVKRN